MPTGSASGEHPVLHDQFRPRHRRNDAITAGNGNDVVIGGTGDNTITLGDGGNTVIGADGNISFLSPGVDGTVESSDPYYAGDNTISVGNGNNPHPRRHGSNSITAATAAT